MQSRLQNHICTTFLGWAGLMLASSSLYAHPVPEVPVRSYFNKDSTLTIKVEVCPRCLVKDSANVPYLAQKEFLKMTRQERNDLKANVAKFVDRIVEFWFEPTGKIEPKFEFSFTKRIEPAEDSIVTPALGSKDERIPDTMVVTAEWKMKLPRERDGYSICATKAGEHSVLFLNYIDGKRVKRVHVLFPGETSYLLKLDALKRQGNEK